MGRYLELDPIALRGGSNGPHGPDWYSYAEGNPLRNSDFFGLDAEMCHRSFAADWAPSKPRHCFLRFDGNDDDTLSFDNDGVHPDPNPTKPDRQCTSVPETKKDDCIKREMKKCKFNCCDCVEQALKACGIFLDPRSWSNRPINPGPQPDSPVFNPDPRFQ